MKRNKKGNRKDHKREMQWLYNVQQINAVEMTFRIWAGEEAEI
jgi:hypothetical protein